MEQDKELKKILLAGSEIASANFTDTTMQRIKEVTVETFYYEPLISSKIKNIFLFVFIGLVFFIFLFCLPGSPGFYLPDWIKMYAISMHTCYKILAFIGLFWFVFIVNNYLQSIKLR